MKHCCVVFYFVPERGKKKREAFVIVAEKHFSRSWTDPLILKRLAFVLQACMLHRNAHETTARVQISPWPDAV